MTRWNVQAARQKVLAQLPTLELAEDPDGGVVEAVTLSLCVTASGEVSSCQVYRRGDTSGATVSLVHERGCVSRLAPVESEGGSVHACVELGVRPRAP